MTLAPERSPSLIDSSGSEFDFSSLPDADTALAPDEPESVDRTPDEKICPTCDLPIVREPGTRGRMPKYHPACRPSAANRLRESVTGDTRTRRNNTKAQKEAEECIAELVKPLLVKLAMGAMLIDPYDGFVIMTSVPGLCDNLKGILAVHDGFRKDVMAMRNGGSIFGLIVAVVLMVMPIVAHHGLIPKSRLREMIENLPVVLFKIQQRMKSGEQAMNDMMERVAEQALKKPTGQAEGNYADASTFPGPTP